MYGLANRFSASEDVSEAKKSSCKGGKTMPTLKNIHYLLTLTEGIHALMSQGASDCMTKLKLIGKLVHQLYLINISIDQKTAGYAHVFNAKGTKFPMLFNLQ